MWTDWFQGEGVIAWFENQCFLATGLQEKELPRAVGRPKAKLLKRSSLLLMNNDANVAQSLCSKLQRPGGAVLTDSRCGTSDQAAGEEKA